VVYKPTEEAYKDAGSPTWEMHVALTLYEESRFLEKAGLI
jgi:hypothetical protein